MAGDSVRSAINHIWSALAPLEIPCALMGGVALAIWNHPRATRDVDFLVGIDPSEVQPLIDHLRTRGFRSKSDSTIRQVGNHMFAQFLFTPPGEFYDVQFDVLLAESELEKSALSRRVERTVPGVDRPIAVLRCEDLILLKLVAGRVLDRADAAMLLRENRDALEVNYLRDWAARLKLTQGFNEIWSEAFPGEAWPE